MRTGNPLPYLMGSAIFALGFGLGVEISPNPQLLLRAITLAETAYGNAVAGAGVPKVEPTHTIFAPLICV